MKRDPLLEFVEEIGDQPCFYRDNCPDFAGTRHGTCLRCKALRAVQDHEAWNKSEGLRLLSREQRSPIDVLKEQIAIMKEIRVDEDLIKLAERVLQEKMNEL